MTPSDARAVGVLVLLNDVRAAVTAYIENTSVPGAASVTVSATEQATLTATTEVNVVASGGSLSGAGTVLALGAQVVTNLVLSTAEAYISASAVNAAGAVTVEAANDSLIDARLLSSVSSGDTALGFLIAFNTIGWKSQNVLFNAIDALLGDSLLADALDGQAPAATRAYIVDSTVTAGELTVTAINAAQLNATVSNAAGSAAAALFGANGKAVGGVLASNKVNSAAQAYVDRTTATVTGALTVAASDDAVIWANVKMVSSSITTNDGGLPLLRGAVSNFLDADFLTSEGERLIRFGQRVRIADRLRRRPLRLR